MRAEQNRNPPRPRAFVREPCVHAGSYCLMRTMNRLFVPSRVMYPTKRRRRRNRAGAEPRFLDRRECYIMSPPRVHSVQGDRFPGACVARYACPGHSRVGRKSAAIPVRIRTRSTYCAIWHVKCPRFFSFPITTRTSSPRRAHQNNYRRTHPYVAPTERIGNEP